MRPHAAVNHFVDPREVSGLRFAKAPARTTEDPALLEALYLLCRQGRLYDVECWIAAGQPPLQLGSHPAGYRRRAYTALGIALKQQNQALVLLLLCNGYDPNLEPQCALDIALKLRRPDLVELLLTGGADPHGMCRSTLFDTYDSGLIERFYGLGVDLAVGHALAKALGYGASNKPLFGFAKKGQGTDERVRSELNMALEFHARCGNEKGSLLCLWAGGDPRASVPALEYDFGYADDEGRDDEDGGEEEDGDGYNAVVSACAGGHVRLLKRFAPDPAVDDFEQLFQVAPSVATVELLARSALPADMTTVVQNLVQSSRWLFREHDPGRALERLFQLGARWSQASAAEVGEVRRALLRTSDSTFDRLVAILATEDYCSDAVRRELARTPAFQKRMRHIGLMPEPGDRGWTRRRGAQRAMAILEAFGLGGPFPPRRRPPS